LKRIIFAIHGIRSPKQGNWIFDFTNFTKQDPRFKDDVFIPYYYGYILAVESVIPVVKYDAVKIVRGDLLKIIKDNPNCELNIIAHSYGTELSFQAIKRSGDEYATPSIFVNKMILVSGIVSRCREIPYSDTLRLGKIKQLHCYCSYEDEVCKFLNPFGRCGYSGFARDKYDKKCYPKPFDDLEIYNHQVDILEHSDYFKDTKYYKEWLDIMATS